MTGLSNDQGCRGEMGIHIADGSRVNRDIHILLTLLQTAVFISLSHSYDHQTVISLARVQKQNGVPDVVK